MIKYFSLLFYAFKFYAHFNMRRRCICRYFTQRDTWYWLHHRGFVYCDLWAYTINERSFSNKEIGILCWKM